MEERQDDPDAAIRLALISCPDVSGEDVLSSGTLALPMAAINSQCAVMASRA